ALPGVRPGPAGGGVVGRPVCAAAPCGDVLCGAGMPCARGMCCGGVPGGGVLGCGGAPGRLIPCGGIACGCRFCGEGGFWGVAGPCWGSRGGFGHPVHLLACAFPPLWVRGVCGLGKLSWWPAAPGLTAAPGWGEGGPDREG